VIWDGEPDTGYSTQYLTIEALEDGNLYVKQPCQYSINDGEWVTISLTTYDSEAINVSNGDKVRFKGNLTDASRMFVAVQLKFNVYGNIMSLKYGDNFVGQTEDFVKQEMFRDSYVIDASNLVLPATTLVQSSCDEMFYRCRYLTSAPVLPATTLADMCYYSMFGECRSLTTAPALPATALTYACYGGMFMGCVSLTTAPEIPATTLLGINCCVSMFNSCPNLVTAPSILPATNLTKNCYATMFYDCNIQKAPELPATTLVEGCYSGMFGYSPVNYIKCLATDISATDCTKSWVSHITSSTGTFVKAAGVEWPTGNSGIPSGWTIQDA
jgi:hypothetical protein